MEMNWLLPTIAMALLFAAMTCDFIAKIGRGLMSGLLGIDIDMESPSFSNYDYEEATLMQRILAHASGPLAKIAYGMFVIFLSGLVMGEGIAESMALSVTIVILYLAFYALTFAHLSHLLLQPASWHWNNLSAAAATISGTWAPIFETDISGGGFTYFLLAVGAAFVLVGMVNLLPCSKCGEKIADELIMRISPEGKTDRLSRAILAGVSYLTLIAMIWVILLSI